MASSISNPGGSADLVVLTVWVGGWMGACVVCVWGGGVGVCVLCVCR